MLWTFIFNCVTLLFITVCDDDDNIMTTRIMIIITIEEIITVFLLLNISTRYNDNSSNAVMISWRLH